MEKADIIYYIEVQEIIVKKKKKAWREISTMITIPKDVMTGDNNNNNNHHHHEYRHHNHQNDQNAVMMVVVVVVDAEGSDDRKGKYDLSTFLE